MKPRRTSAPFEWEDLTPSARSKAVERAKGELLRNQHAILREPVEERTVLATFKRWYSDWDFDYAIVRVDASDPKQMRRHTFFTIAPFAPWLRPEALEPLTLAVCEGETPQVIEVLFSQLSQSVRARLLGALVDAHVAAPAAKIAGGAK